LNLLPFTVFSLPPCLFDLVHFPFFSLSPTLFRQTIPLCGRRDNPTFTLPFPHSPLCLQAFFDFNFPPLLIQRSEEIVRLQTSTHLVAILFGRVLETPRPSQLLFFFLTSRHPRVSRDVPLNFFLTHLITLLVPVSFFPHPPRTMDCCDPTLYSLEKAGSLPPRFFLLRFLEISSPPVHVVGLQYVSSLCDESAFLFLSPS